MLPNSLISIKHSIYSGLTVILLTAVLLASLASDIQAAPPTALPPCGDNTVQNDESGVGSSNSNSPDIALSFDSRYTAVTWTEGSGSGPLMLAYSDIFTTTHTWSLFGTNGQVGPTGIAETSLAFDPQQNNRVHIAYTTLSGVLSYASCLLGGGCTLVSNITASGASKPQIAAANEGVVIVYQSTPGVKYVHIGDGATTAQGPYQLDLNGFNPAAVYAQNKIHVAYYNPSAIQISYRSLGTAQISYRSLGTANIGTANNLSPTSATKLGDGDGIANNNNYSTVAIAAKDNRVAVVWDHFRSFIGDSTSALSSYRLAQNFSPDGGTTWNSVARSIPADLGLFNAETGNDDYWESYDEDFSSELFRRLQPDVTLSKDSSNNYYAHVVWHAQMINIKANAILLPAGDPKTDVGPDRGTAGHDILYAYTQLPASNNPGSMTWHGVQMGNDGAIESNPTYANPNGLIKATVEYTATHGVTDLTSEYFYNSYKTSGNNLGRDTIQPATVFVGDHTFNNGHKNRLQVVYLSQDAVNSSLYEVRYNGFELGSGNFPYNISTGPDTSVRDSDCDSISDAVEIARPPDELDLPDPPFCYSGNGFNNFKEMNCDGPKNLNLAADQADYIPDYLDTDADGDGLPDFSDAEWRVSFLGCGPGSNCIFLPVLMKN